SFYASFSAGHDSGLGVGNGTSANQSGGMTAQGGTFGGYVLYPSGGPMNVGADARLIVENSANSTPYGNKILGGLVGLRIDGEGARLPIVPYFQFEVGGRSEEHTSELQSQSNLVCRLLLEKKKTIA